MLRSCGLYNSPFTKKPIPSSDYYSSNTVECGVFHIFGCNSKN